jgi:hypothetical protein
MSNVRPSPIAGTWYPGQTTQLAQTVDAFLAEATQSPVAVPGQIMGVVAPHAGHRYSGRVAAHAFGPLRGTEVDVIALIGPMHSAGSSRLLTTGHDAFWTPLGEVAVDRAGLAAVQAACEIPIQAIFNDPEHSLEIELPFLQRIFESFQLIPIMMRDDSPAACLALGQALAVALAGRRHLLVASSDLSHFYPQPVAQRLDDYMLQQIETGDPLAVLKAEDEEKGFACGRAAIAAVLAAARQLGSPQVKVVRHATSGAVTGDYSSVVGYGAALIWK